MAQLLQMQAAPDLAKSVLSFNQIAAASATQTLGIAEEVGYVDTVRIAAITPLTGNATYTADVKKNGTTILTGVMSLLTATAARTSVLGTLTTAPTPVQPGDFFETVTVNTPGTGAAPANVVIQLGLTQDLSGAVSNGANGNRIALGIAPFAGYVIDARATALALQTGNDTYTVDIRKNGTSILGAAIPLTTSMAVRQSIAGEVTTNVVAPGDYFEAVFTPTHGTGTLPQGISAQLTMIQSI